MTPDANPSPQAPAPVAPSATGAGLGDVLMVNDLAQSAIGIYTVDVDLESLSGTVRLKETQRVVAESEIYNLEIGTFLQPDSFTLDSISLTPTTVDLTYSATHPFDPPADPCGAATAGNRLDLAVTGRVLWLLGGSDGNTYFAGDGDYEANTSLVTNADGYFQPLGMVDSTGLDTNTFPYQEIVDEAADNRAGLSNGGNMHGNYPGTTSWTQANYTAGITGFGIWGQGQTATNTISLDRAELTLGGSFTTDVALLVKYEDPRGAGTGPEKRGNRLPCGDNPANGEPRDLVYRAPHFALDVAVVANVTEGGGFQDLTASSATVSCTVVDWDNAATEHTATNLAGVADTSLVSAGESGLPVVDVDIAGIPGSEGDPLTPGGGSGEPDDPLTFTGLVDGTPDQGMGTYTGMVRATDPVDVTPPTDWNLNHFNLGAGGTLTPIAQNFEGAVLQAFPVDVLPACDEPTGTWALSSLSIPNGGTTNVIVTNVTIDPGSTIFSLSIDWDDGNGYTTVDTGLAPGPGPFGPYTSPNYTLSNPTVAETRTIAVRAISDNCPLVGDLTNTGGDTVTINPCTATTVRHTANFETLVGDNAYAVLLYGLPNGDSCGTRCWTRCSTPVLPAGMGSSGFRWNTGPDTTTCTNFANDYGTNTNGSVMSPAINLTGFACAEVQFDGFRNDGGATASHNLMYSTNAGGSWQTLLTQTNAVGQSDPDVIVDADAIAGNAAVILRFWFEDEAAYGAFGCWTPALNPIAGWAIDNVIVRAN